MPAGPHRPDAASRGAALETLVATYETALLRYAGRILANSDAAQDVVQNTFIKLFRKWKTDLAPSTQLATWLYRVAHNEAVDHIRREDRRRRLQLRHAEQKKVEWACRARENEPVSDAAWRAAQALRELSLREQQLVILKVYEEKSYREISDITGLKEGNIGYILHHAMKKMARRLRPAGDRDDL